jgi:hypothetical protein
LEQLMRIHVEVDADDVGATPQSLCWDERRVGIVEIVDRWYGPDYRYVKVKGDDGGVYILRFDVIRNEWVLIMFVSARGEVLRQAMSRAINQVPATPAA